MNIAPRDCLKPVQLRRGVVLKGWASFPIRGKLFRSVAPPSQSKLGMVSLWAPVTRWGDCSVTLNLLLLVTCRRNTSIGKFRPKFRRPSCRRASFTKNGWSKWSRLNSFVLTLPFRREERCDLRTRTRWGNGSKASFISAASYSSRCRLKLLQLFS